MSKESFVKNTLDGDERIIAIARITRWKFLDETIIAILFACVIVTVELLFDNLLVTAIVAGVLALIWLIKSFKDLIFICMTIMSITTRKVVYKTGFVKTRSVDIPLRNIDNVQVYYSVLGKIFNFGKIRIESRSEPVEVNYVYNPTRFKNLIDRASQGYIVTQPR